jgi:alpha-tubulin suppressor-like RCC1 family protein
VEHVAAVQSIAGGYHAAYALAGSRVWAWGDNEWGELGAGTHSTGECYTNAGKDCASGVATKIPGLTSVTAITANGGYNRSGSYALALDSSGQVWGWGSNELGKATGVPGCTGRCNTDSPSVLVGLPSASAITAGGKTGYAIIAE